MKALCHSAAPWRDFLTGPRAAGKEQGAWRGWVRPGQAPAWGQEAAQPRQPPWEGFSGAAHFTPRPL